MTNDELNALIQRHGGLVSAPVAVDPEIDNPSIAGRETKPKIPNPNPTYRYNLKNGKFFTAKDVGTDTESSFQIIDPGSAVQPLTPADRLPSAAQDLVKLDVNGNVIPPSDTSTRAAKLRDPSTGAVTDLPDAKTNPEGTLKEFGNQLLNIKPDGSYTVIASKPAEGATQAKSLKDAPDGSTWEYDPSKPEGSRLTKVFDAPTKDKPAPTTTKVNGTTYERDASTGEWSQAAGLPTEKKATQIYGTGANDQFRVTLDDQGNEVSRVPNPNYVAPKPTPPTQLTPDTVSANIPLLKPDGTIEFQPNKNQVMVSQAMSDLLNQVGVRVSAGQLSMADAKDMLTGAVNAMNAQTAQAQAAATQEGTARSAAGDILSTQAQGATAAAGMLNQRAQTAQNLVQQGLGAVTGSAGRYGQYSGGILSPMAGFGQNLVQGAQGFATELGGGQAVYDTAVRMVQAADPNGQNPDRASAVALLRQLMDKYHQATGQEIPAVTATRAASASQQTGGMVAPQPQPQPQAQPVPQGFNQYGPVMGTPGVGMAGNVSLAPAAPQAPTAPFVAPPLAVNNLTNLDPRLRGAIY